MAVNIDCIMKKLFWRALFFLVPFLYSIYVCSQPAGKKNCGTTCFSSEVISVEESSATCKVYELKVSYTGDCAHALSHYAVAIPCGEVSNVSNSENWAQVIGTDPTTGLSGFKIDDIGNFGDGERTSFTVKFTLCSSNEACAEQLKCWQPLVAYKASTCVNYETVEMTCKSLKASLEHRDATCFGAEDGSLAVVIEDGSEPFTFLWSDNASVQSREAVKAGTYSVVVKDATGAEVTLSAVVAQPEQISLQGVISPASCNGKADGAIDLSVSGGSGPYQFAWSNGATSEDITALASGQYFATVTDQNNCSATARFTVSNESALSLVVGMTAPDCNSSNGSIDLSVAGGEAPYSFKWSTGQSSEDLSDVSAGLYTVTVTDNVGCSAQRSVFLKENNTLRMTGLSTPASCSGGATGSIDLTISGGTAPYSYSWSTGASTEDLSGIGSGFYKVTVEDSKGCTATASYTVTTETFQVPRTVVQPTCHGDTNGSITLLEPIGGTAPYTFSWSNGATGTSLTDLAPGSYSVTVTDATGCSKTFSISISAPTPIAATASVSSVACNEDGSYVIDLSVSGGTGPYQYQWSNGASTEDLQGLSGGTYTVVITDANGCAVSKDVVVEVGTPLSCLIDEPADGPVCGSTNNTLSTSVIDADSYSWSVESNDIGWTITSSGTSSIIYTAGTESTATFTLAITKDGCTKVCSYTISTCVPDQSNEEPGGEEPEGEEPGGEEPGGEEPGGEEPGNGTPGSGDVENCDECFNTVTTRIASSGSCHTYEVEVSTNGLCAHELSHWTIAVPCGTVSNYSNSGGWKMEIGLDPTTGLRGLKVDGISSFGKQPASFRVRFTLCVDNCELSDWSPVVAYKAGQCVSTTAAETDESNVLTAPVAAYPNPFSEVIHFQWQAVRTDTRLDIIDQYGNIVLQSTSADANAEGFYIDLPAASLPKGMYYYRLTVDGRVHNGKLSKR